MDKDPGLKKSLLERYSFSPSSKEEKALKDLRSPIELKPGKEIKLSHPKYRGPWHLHYMSKYSGPSGIQERIGGSTPTNFAIISPDMMYDLSERQEQVGLPYRGRPVVLQDTKGLLFSVQIMDSPYEHRMSLGIGNTGKPVEGDSLLTIVPDKYWEKDVFQKHPRFTIVLPRGHRSTVTTLDGEQITLTGVNSSELKLSYSISSKKA